MTEETVSSAPRDATHTCLVITTAMISVITLNANMIMGIVPNVPLDVSNTISETVCAKMNATMKLVSLI
jgi:hypothetical protein